MKKVNELLDLGNKYYLVIGNYFGTKEYGIIGKRKELTVENFHNTRNNLIII